MSISTDVNVPAPLPPDAPRLSVAQRLQGLGGNARQYGIFGALVVIVLLFQVLTDGKLLLANNVAALFQQNAYVMILAIGMVIVIIGGHIDLSVGSVVALTGAVSAIMVIKNGQPWWVGIEQPEGLEAPRTVAALFDLAVATSGDALNAFEHDGRRYPHTIDGSTGRPIDNGMVSVTVIHPSAMTADAWATALSVMGPYEGPPYAEAAEIAAHFVERTPRGLVEHMSPAFHAMMDEGE